PSVRGERQLDPDPGASVWVVVSDRLAAVGARYRGHDRQAEPGAAVCPVPRLADAAKPFEDMREELVGKAGPVVTDLDHEHLARVAMARAVTGCLPPFAGHVHDAAVGGMPDRVVDQVAQRLLQPAWIGDRGQVAVRPRVDGDAAGACLRGETSRG